MKNNQAFTEKVLYAVIILFGIKLVYLLITNFKDGLGAVLFSLVIAVIIFFIIGIITAGINDDSSSSNYGASNSNSNVVLRSSIYDRLRQGYIDQANRLIAEKQYKKAAHIYLNLLKDKYKAAETLQQGNLYNEAAYIYLHQLNNKDLAAECYEKGNNYEKAIRLYIDLKKYEKAGDVYMLLNNRPEARKQYQKVIDDYIEKDQYVKASLFYKNKLNEAYRAQALLLEGWKKDKDAYNCLNNYFENIKDLKKLNTEITRIYQHETPNEKKNTFLQLMKHEFKKDNSLEETTRNIAYEIITEGIATDKNIANELVFFNKDNKQLTKDIVRFKMNKT